MTPTTTSTPLTATLPDGYDLDELIESVVTLDSWIDSRGGRLESGGLSVGNDEVVPAPRRAM